MKTIYLEYKGNEFTISNEAYERIVEIVNAGQVCRTCHQPYTEDRPQVTRNLCTSCFLRKEASHSLTFLGPLPGNRDGYITYRFLDPLGYVYLSHSSSDAGAQRDERETLRYWHFTVPESFEVNGKTIRLYSNQWQIYGDFRNKPVVIAEYREWHGDPLTLRFFAYKNDGYIELNRRKGDVRRMFTEARRQAEGTKDARGEYHLDGYTVYQLFDSHLYTLVADIASEEYNQTCQQVK